MHIDTLTSLLTTFYSAIPEETFQLTLKPSSITLSASNLIITLPTTLATFKPILGVIEDFFDVGLYADAREMCVVCLESQESVLAKLKQTRLELKIDVEDIANIKESYFGKEFKDFTKRDYQKMYYILREIFSQ